MEMDAGRASPWKSFRAERKRRLFLARSRAPGLDPPFRSISRRTHRHGRGSRTRTAGPVPLHIAIPDLVRSNRSSPEKTTNPMKAVYVEKFGGPENLINGDLPKPQPGPGQALVKIAATGVNFIDVYFRIGLYPAAPPVVLGNEGAGTVEAVGPDVTNVRVGDRVAYAMARGSYAEYAVVPAWQLVKTPDGLDSKVAAGAMLQGMTAHYLTQD